MPICGDTCDMLLDGANVSGHQFTITFSSNEIDTRKFGDGDWGSFTVCNKQGTVSVVSYEYPDVEVGDNVTFQANVGANSFTIPVVVQEVSIPVDAKDIVSFTTNMRINGDPVIS